MNSSKETANSINLEGFSEKAKRVLANLTLEGIYPSHEALEDMKLLDAGKLTKEQFFERALARAKSAKS